MSIVLSIVKDYIGFIWADLFGTPFETLIDFFCVMIVCNKFKGPFGNMKHIDAFIFVYFSRVCPYLPTFKVTPL